MRTLVCIEITTPTLVWSRAFISDLLPTQEDLTYYYNRLCGLEGSVSFRTESVPESFNETLLYTGCRLPTQFPVHDLETQVLETEKRDKYNLFLKQLCDMERSRAQLHVFPPEANRSEPGLSTSSTSTSNSKSRQWVQDLLRSLNTDDIFGEGEGLVAAVSAVETAPLGWILTPVVKDIRETRGSRIVLDATLGAKWDALLGTDLYPDMVVSRRISTQTWAFQHPSSDALVRATLDWYLAAQDATVVDGMSGWIFNADKEMNALFGTFKRIKVHESLIAKHTPKAGGKPQQVVELLSKLEGRCLGSALSDETIQPISLDLFQKYMSYLFMAFQIPKNIYTEMAAYSQSVQRWVRGAMGFRDSEPLVESWRDTWTLLMRNKTPTEERIRMFLRTLDCWNTLEAGLLSLPQRKEVADEWVYAFIDNMMIPDKGGKIKSILLHEKVKEWCYKYLPTGLFASNFSPMAIGPLFTRREFNSVKRGDGRYMMGVKFKFPEMELSMDSSVKVSKSVSITTDIATGTTEKQSTVSGMIVAEQDGNRIEHFFSTQEIHLGTI